MKTSRLLPIITAFVLLAFAGCVKEGGDVSVKFKDASYELKVGETLDLVSELEITNSSQKPVWQSSQPTVAKVSPEGVLTALAAGEADIKAVVEGKAATCAIKIVDIAAQKIELNAPQSLSSDGTWGTIKATVEPAGFNMDNLVWTFTPSDESLVFETEKLRSSEYRLRFKGFVESGAVMVTVADRNSEVSQSVTISVTEEIIVASKINLTMPDELTSGGVWASVKASVEPEGYDVENLEWEFRPSSDALGFKSEKVSASEYKVCFDEYVDGGSVTVIVSDKLSQVFNQGRIKVKEMPDQGLKDLRVSPDSLVMTLSDEPMALSLVVSPDNYDRALLEWSSSDEDVVVVDGGTITVVGLGEAVITVRDVVSGREASCSVKVVTPNDEASITRIELSQTSLNMRVGEDAVQLTATCYDENDEVVENYSGLVWSADSMIGENNLEVKVVEVSQMGVVTPLRAGTTQIVVTDKNNAYLKAICHVTVQAAAVKVTDVKLLPSSKNIEIGENFTLTAVIVPENAENKSLTYASTDEKVAVVTQDGVVTGVGGGEAVISATSESGVKGTCRVTVAEEVGVSLSDTKLTMSVGQEKQLTATVRPAGSDQTVTWSSSAPDVVSVEDGLIKALKDGKAVITAASGDLSATCEVIVVAGDVKFEISIVPSDENLPVHGLMQDKTVRLNAFYTRADDGSEYVPLSTGWASSDLSIATVDEEGNVTAVAETIELSGLDNGKKVTITHTADNKVRSYVITVVKALPESVEMTAVPEVNGVKYKMMHGDTFTFKAKVYPEKASQEVWFAGGGFYQLADNTFTATKVGTEDFIAYAADNTSARAFFSIEVLPVVMTDMSLNHTALELVPGGQASLSVNILPENTSYQEITWSSSDENVAVVDADGVVTAVAAGDAEITARQAENDRSCVCAVSVSEPDTSVKVGHYYYSTGRTSSRPDEDETVYGKVIGVVFSTSNPSLMGDTHLVADYPECTRGYVVSTTEYTSEFHTSDLAKSSLCSWTDSNGYDVNNQTVANGYGNSSAYMAYDGNAAFTLFHNTDGPLAQHRDAVAVPSGATQWYVPSFKEMQMLHESLAVVNASLEAASGAQISSSGTYWQSTIVEDQYGFYHNYGFDMAKGGWTAYTKTYSDSLPVRIILAF